MPTDAAFGRRRVHHTTASANGADVGARSEWLEGVFPAASRATPYCTVALLLVLALVFVCQVAFSLGGGGADAFNYRSLLAFGGDDGALLKQGQWWRLFTAPLLHASLAHVVDNGVCLLVAGVLLERVIGWGWFLAAYVASGLGGELVSIGINDPRIIGIGASGAIVGVIATCLVCSFHADARWRRWPMRAIALGLLVMALLPLGAHAANNGVNYSAHAGGGIVGVVFGLLINAVWLQGELRPLLGPLAAPLGLIGALAALVAGVMILIHMPAYRAIDATLAPDQALPRPRGDASGPAAALLRRYPDDPRLRLLRAGDLANAGDFAAAEAQTRTALGKSGQLTLLGPEFVEAAEFQLAAILSREGKSDEAAAVAKALCRDAIDPRIRQALMQGGLCGPVPEGDWPAP